MKLFNKLKYILLLIPVLITGCDDYIDVNESPNEPIDVPVTLMFPGALVTTAYHVGGDLNIAGSFFSQQWATGVNTQYLQIDRYDQGQCDGRNSWTELYANALFTFQEIIDKSEAELNGRGDNYIASAEIMKAYCFSVLTDLYGDIPFNDALKGSNNFSPTPTSQETIYEELQATLDDAIERIDNADGNDLVWTEFEDVMYQGDMSKWKRFANTLKLRLYMRLSEVDETTASQGIANLINNGALLMDSVADNGLIYFGETATNRNPIAQSYSTTATITLSKTLVDVMIAYSDSRLFSYSTSTNNFVGTENGNLAAFNNARLGTDFIDNTAPVNLLTYEESLFIRAEAAARGWTAENDSLLYVTGMEASMDKYELTDEQKGFIFNNPNTFYPTSGTIDEKWEKIYLQKWIALVGQGVESFSEARRANFRFPSISTLPTGGIQPATNSLLSESVFPGRLVYPVAETSTNENIQLIPLSTKVWFSDF